MSFPSWFFSALVVAAILLTAGGAVTLLGLLVADLRAGRSW